MTDFEKGKIYAAMEQIKNSPPFMQDFNLIMICRLDPTGQFEKMARILADHKMPTEEIVPCIMEYFQDMISDDVKKE